MGAVVWQVGVHTTGGTERRHRGRPQRNTGLVSQGVKLPEETTAALSVRTITFAAR